MKLLAGLALSGVAMAFTDTAAFFSSRLLVAPVQYVTEASDLSSHFQDITQQFCDGDEQLFIYRVRNLVHDSKLSAAGTYIEHVRYKSAGELDFSLDSKCTVGYSAGDNTNVVIVDVEDEGAHYVSEFLQDGKFVVVQGKPAFLSPESQLASLRDYFNRKVYGELQNREDADEEEYSAAEIEDDFRTAEALIEQESDSIVTALAGESKATSGSAVKKNSNLFTNYQFFTPGIWLSIIVAFFLIYVMTTAVGWVTSIQTSYGAFEKQVDYEKKTE